MSLNSRIARLFAPVSRRYSADEHHRAGDVGVIGAVAARGELVERLRERELLRVRVRGPLVERDERLDVRLLVALAVDAHDRDRVAGNEARQHLALHDPRDLGLLVGVRARDVDQHRDRLRVVTRVGAGDESEREDRERGDRVRSASRP